MATTKTTLICLAITLSLSISYSQPGNYSLEYIEHWKQFYPSRALDQGMHTAIFGYEDFSIERITEWLTYNQKMLQLLSDTNSPYCKENRMDARLLRVQAQSEMDQWEKAAPHRHSLSLYARLIAQATEQVREVTFLSAPEKNQLFCKRLASVQKLCATAKQTLTSVDRNDLERGLKRLNGATVFYEKELPTMVSNPACENFAEQCRKTADQIRALITHVNTLLLPEAKEATPLLGRDEYARRLALYTDSNLTPDVLATMAMDEIMLVRKTMGDVSRQYLQKQYPNQPVPEDYETWVRKALADMEKDAPISGEDYLQFWLELSDAATRFIEEHQIATLPPYQTLRIMSAPESAGPAARIGWVDSAPAFAPNPVTTLYLPSIPETFPEQDRKDFWSSFNKPFNRMIVIHELFPGHYMQIKISRETPHPIRMLFPYGVYIEGWATFCERVLLDEGWEKENPLTFLAHLRKRLENANRAYTSVQVHCNGWDQEQVLQFSTKTSLLAPQFAKSLWGRIISSPMQLTSYFLGGKQFTDLLASEKERLGDRFVLQDFMDTILRAGPIPIDEFPSLFAAAK